MLDNFISKVCRQPLKTEMGCIYVFVIVFFISIHTYLLKCFFIMRYSFVSFVRAIKPPGRKGWDVSYLIYVLVLLLFVLVVFHYQSAVVFGFWYLVVGIGRMPKVFRFLVFGCWHWSEAIGFSFFGF